MIKMMQTEESKTKEVGNGDTEADNNNTKKFKDANEKQEDK